MSLRKTLCTLAACIALLMPSVAAAYRPDLASEKGETPFSDISDSHSSAVLAALAEQGVVTGSTDGKFCPDRPITYAEAATMLGRAFNLFSSDRNSWYSAYLTACQNVGIFQNCTPDSAVPHSAMLEGLQKLCPTVSGKDLASFWQQDDSLLTRLGAALLLDRVCRMEQAHKRILINEYLTHNFIYDHGDAIGDPMKSEEDVRSCIATAMLDIPSTILRAMNGTCEMYVTPDLSAAIPVSEGELLYGAYQSNIQGVVNSKGKLFFALHRIGTWGMKWSGHHRILLHEIGHYVDRQLDLYGFPEEYFQAEAKNIAEVTGWDNYGEMERGEYFAELFAWYWMASPEEIVKGFELAPKSCNYVLCRFAAAKFDSFSAPVL